MYGWNRSWVNEIKYALGRQQKERLLEGSEARLTGQHNARTVEHSSFRPGGHHHRRGTSSKSQW